MRGMFLLLFIVLSTVAQGRELRILMIGNSFSICAGRFLPQIVQSVPGHKLTLTSLYIGGCSLQRHWESVQKAEQNPDFKPYLLNTWYSDAAAEKQIPGNLPTELKKKWDIITLQQCSHLSWKPESYQPYLENLIAYIRRRAPDAKIVFQQTWAYRNSDARIAPDTMQWGFGQQEMYDRLTENYCAAAKKYGVALIPTGLAVQNTRQNRNTVYPRPETLLQGQYTAPDVPSSAGDPVGSYRWQEVDGKPRITQDSIHLNAFGEYLQACVWFSKLYGVNTSEIRFVPDFMTRDEADFLKKCAQQAVDAKLP